MEEETLLRRIRANRGALEYDQIYHNARVVDVFTERIRLMDVAILDGCFCALNPGHQHAKEHVDCKGQYMAPGLLDGHMHIETSHLNPMAWAQATLPHGTTGIFFDAMMSASVYGTEFLTVLKSLLQKVPTRVFYQIPSRIPAKAELETMGGILGPDEIRKLLEDPQTVSLGEVNYLSVLQEEPNILAKILSARNQNRLINGHCPEIAPEDINTVAAVGITDDHESTTLQELAEKLARGLTVMIREGSIEPNVEALIKGVVKYQLPTDNLLFCTDDKYPPDLLEKGHIDYAVNKAIACGLAPIKALKMATFNTARYYGLTQDLGSVAPGRKADFILFDSLEQIVPNQVYIGGNLAAEHGQAIGLPDSAESYADHTIHLSRSFSPADLALSSDASEVNCLVMEVQENNLCPKAIAWHLPVQDGLVMPDLANDVLPIAVICRYGQNNTIGKGFIRGLKLNHCAIASSLASEGNNIAVCGTNYQDMARAIQEVAKIDGGMVIVKNNQLIAANPMPIGGIMYACSASEAVKRSRMMEKMLSHLGCQNPSAFTYLCVAPAPSIPDLGLTDQGLIDVRSQKIISPILEK